MYILDYKINKYLYQIRDEFCSLYCTYLIKNNVKITKNKRDLISKVIGSFCLNTVKAVAFNEDQMVIPLDKNVFSHPVIYNGFKTNRKISYRYFRTFIDWLVVKKYVTLEKGGVYDWTLDILTGKMTPTETEPSILIFHQKLKDMIQPYADRSKLPTLADVLIIRDKKGKSKQFKLNERSKNLVKHVTAYNELTRKHDIELENGKIIDVQGRKIFNETIDRGGRMYTENGNIQTLSGDMRKRLKIDGEEVVELDYSALHPSICAELNKEVLDKDFDPYHIDLPGYDKTTLRKISKKALLIMINSDSWHSARLALNMDIGQMYDMDDLHSKGLTPPVIDTKEILSQLADRNSYMGNFFFSGDGIYLQNHDSKIMDYILDYFTQREEVAIPIHDSVIVRKGLQDTLYDVMMQAYKHVLGSNHNCKISVK